MTLATLSVDCWARILVVCDVDYDLAQEVVIHVLPGGPVECRGQSYGQNLALRRPVISRSRGDPSGA